jgi:hypothetical protein
MTYLDPDLINRLARAEWRVRYDQFVNLTNQRDAQGHDALEWPPGLFEQVVEFEAAGFDPRRSPDADLDTYAHLIKPVYSRLPPLAVLRQKAAGALAKRYTRTDFRPTVQPVRGYDPERFAGDGPYYHGTRAFDTIVAAGLCAGAIREMVDSDPIGDRAPASWWERYGDTPPMSAVNKAQNRGYDFGYSWLGYWREAVFNWYAHLDFADQRRVAWSITGIPEAFPLKTSLERDATADALGDLILFFITERVSTAESYGRERAHEPGAGAVLEVDPRYAQAFDVVEDDLQGESSYALIIPPGICPQIDWRGLKYKGTPLGAWF